MTLFALALSWMATASAAEPGRVFFETSPGAQVVVFPRSEERTIDIGIYRNRAPIRDQINGTSARYTLDVDAVSIGSGTSYLTIHTDRDGILPTVHRQDGFFEVRLSPGTVVVAPPPPAPTFEEVLNPDQVRRAAPPPRVPLTPLRGDAATIATDPRNIRLEIPSWDVELDVTHPFGQLLGEKDPSWNAIDDYRQVLTSTDNDYLKQVSRYRLGKAYADIGLPRESSFYLHELLEGDHRPDITAFLFAAQADFGIGRWEEGREHCRSAVDAGASEADVLACLVAPSLATGNPAPSELGRMLAVSTENPERRLLAAQLLQMDHRHREAKPLLESVATQLPLARMRDAYLSLGDARYALGEYEEAVNAWTQVKRIGDLGEVARLRIFMAEIVQKGRTSWAKHIPELARVSREPGLQGIEAHYLLAQIAQIYGNMEDAATHLNALWMRNSQIAFESDIPDRLLAVCTERLKWLQQEDRHVDFAASFEDCWRPDLDAYAGNTRTLQQAALAYEALGLHERALRIQQRVTTHHTTAKQDDPAALTHLARFYVNAGRPLEALDTIAYSKRHFKAAALRGPIQVSEALALEATGDDAAAEKAWRGAAAVTSSRKDGRRGLGMLLAHQQRCKEAAPYLAELDSSDNDGLLSRSRCLLHRNQGAKVRPDMDPLLSASDTYLRADATWIAAAAAWQTRKPDAVPDIENELWQRILDEERTAQAFDARLDVLAKELTPIKRNP
jgi:tetratricopeptide (TPR) repeat protein